LIAHFHGLRPACSPPTGKRASPRCPEIGDAIIAQLMAVREAGGCAPRPAPELREAARLLGSWQ